MPYRYPARLGSGYLQAQGFAAVAPDPTPSGWAGSTSAATSLGVSVLANDYTSWKNWVGRDPLARLVFTTGTGGQNATKAQMLSDFTGFMNSSTYWGTDTILVVSTQLVFGTSQTLEQAATTNANDSHWQDVGAAVAARNRDIRQASGAPQLAMRIGWEINGNWYTWSTSRHLHASNNTGSSPTDTRAGRSAWAAQAFDRAVLNMGIGGCDLNEVEFVINFANAWGSLADNTAAIPSSATCISADFYDTSSLYSANQANKAGQRAAVWASKVTAAGGLAFCRDAAISRGLKFCADEWGVSNWTNNTGGDDNPDFIQNVYDYFNVAAVTGNLGWLCYFEREGEGGANLHRLNPSHRDYNFVLTAAKFLDLFA